MDKFIILRWYSILMQYWQCCIVAIIVKQYLKYYPTLISSPWIMLMRAPSSTSSTCCWFMIVQVHNKTLIYMIIGYRRYHPKCWPWLTKGLLHQTKAPIWNKLCVANWKKRDLDFRMQSDQDTPHQILHHVFVFVLSRAIINMEMYRTARYKLEACVRVTRMCCVALLVYLLN